MRVFATMLLAFAAALPMLAAVNQPAGAVEPQVSTADEPQWYAMMSSHLSETDRQDRYMYYDGTRLATAQMHDGLGGLSDQSPYAWRLEDNGDGTVRLVHSGGLQVFVPSNARPQVGTNVPLTMQSDGSSWVLRTSASTGQSDCADLQYVLDWTGYDGNAFLNAMGAGESNYGLTIYEAGAHQASGWFFVPLTIEGGTDPDPGPDPDPGIDPEPPTSDSGYIVADPFETMIRLGRMTPESPIYTMPAGSSGSLYVASAVTSGDAVDYPLSYIRSSAPSKSFVVVSRQTSLVMRDAAFDLVLTLSGDPSSSSVTAWTDWDRDGAYETAGQEPVIDAASRTVTQRFTVPADAALGKTRVRVRIESSTPSGADAAMSSGRTYDFVIYVLEAEERNDCYVSVSSSDTRYGTAYVETTPNADGRYDKGTDVTVVAVRNLESDREVTFEGWRIGGETISTDTAYTFTVSESVHLTAMFTVPGPVAPVVSTEDDPVWYQIMNAHTATERANRYVAYDTNLDGTYTTPLRAEKPADTTDKFLWRLEDAGDGMVYIVNRGNGLRIEGSNVLESVAFDCGTTGTRFMIANSGAENESWSIMYEGISDRLLNAQDGTWKIVLYNAGIGTGSGWYFTEVEVSEPDPKPDTGIGSTDGQTAITARLDDGTLSLSGLPAPCRVRVFNLSGQLLAALDATTAETSVGLDRMQHFALIVVEAAGNKTVVKCVDAD